MATAQLEYVFLWSGPNDVNDSRGIFLLIQTFEDHVITGLFFVLYQLVLICTGLDHKGVCLLADLTFKGLPEVRAVIGGHLFLSLYFQPRFKALEMDGTYRSRTATALKQRVLR